MKRIIFLLILLPFFGDLFSQGSYAGPVGSPTSIAIHKDSSIIQSWATACVLQSGYLDIKDTSLGKISSGSAENAIGPALKNGIVSLGDSGVATLTFEGIIYDGIGPDFAVFENGFDDTFLELAFVEVSSDGQNFFRFPSISDTDTSQEIGSYGTLNTSYIHNLAGKYPIGYGTPFDLNELSNIPGLDIQNITHVRLVDVIGTMNDSLASRDSKGVKINDPYPTAWPGGGFDLDAVAAIHVKPTGINELLAAKVRLFPNPVSSVLHIENIEFLEYQLFDFSGKLLKRGAENYLDLSSLQSGVYLLKIITEQGSIAKKISKK